jgi:hypothetical protein
MGTFLYSALPQSDFVVPVFRYIASCSLNFLFGFIVIIFVSRPHLHASLKACMVGQLICLPFAFFNVAGLLTIILSLLLPVEEVARLLPVSIVPYKDLVLILCAIAADIDLPHCSNLSKNYPLNIRGK